MVKPVGREVIGDVLTLFLQLKTKQPSMLQLLAGVCGATGWQQLPLTRARRCCPSSARCLKEYLLLGFPALHLGIFTLRRGAQKSSSSGVTAGVQLASELYQCWQGCSEVPGTRGQQHQQSHINPCWLCSSCQGMERVLRGLWLAQLSLHHTPFRFGDT